MSGSPWTRCWSKADSNSWSHLCVRVSLGERDGDNESRGPETVDRLSQNTGMAKGELLPLIAQVLPTIVDRLTP
jgi:hypothetical protein